MNKLIKNRTILPIVWIALVLIVLVVGLSLVVARAAAAVTATGDSSITLSPSSTTLTVDAGEVLAGSMKVINEGGVAYDFSAYARPYGVTNELYEPDFTTQNINANVYKWVQFEQSKYRIEPGQTVDVKYTIRVPADAAPGGHYGVLFAETEPDELASTGVARKQRVGNLLYVTVKGANISKGEFKAFILPFWQTSAPMISSARIENTGNVDFRAKVRTTAKDLFGRTKYNYTSDPIVLPQTTRLVEMKWENGPNFGIFKVDQSVQFLDQTHQNDGYVLIAPKWAPLIVVILVAIGAVYAVLQRRNSRR